MRITALVLAILGFATAAPSRLSFTEHPTSQSQRELLGADIRGDETKTFLSSVLSLRPGEVINTDPNETLIQPPSEDDIAITGLVADLVDENGDMVPLTEVYLHHWVFYRPSSGYTIPCIGYEFGVGGESRNSPVIFGDYAMPSYAGEWWTANIHVLRIDDVDDVQKCIECWAPDGSTGGINYCPDGSFCATNSTAPAKNYYLRYTVSYQTKIPSADKLITAHVLDATPCHTEYDIPVGDGVDTLVRDWQVQKAGDLVFAANHQHIGAIHMNVTITRADTGLLEELCFAEPVYGTGSEAGNEDGYVVKIPPCYFHDDPVPLNVGDVIHIEALYDNTEENNAPHYGVMALFYMGIAEGGPATFTIPW